MKELWVLFAFAALGNFSSVRAADSKKANTQVKKKKKSVAQTKKLATPRLTTVESNIKMPKVEVEKKTDENANTKPELKFSNEIPFERPVE